MRLPPLEVIASWPTPNYDDPVTRGPAPIIFNLVLFPLVCFFMALRMYTRLRISKSFGRDDWLIFAALVCSPIQSSLLKLTSAVSHLRIRNHQPGRTIPL